MKTKNIYQKAFFATMLVGGFLMTNTSVASSNGIDVKNSPIINVICAASSAECSSAGNIINYSIIIFLSLIVWSISPVGILFFLASGALISKRSSRIKRTIAWLMQVLAFFTWLSFMILLFLAFFDSISFNAFRLGGTALDMAIVSGAGFFIVMFVIALIEKGIEKEIAGERKAKKKNDNTGEDKRENDNKKKEDEESMKIAGMEFLGLKDKIRRKVKDGLKDIVDDEIEKRL